MTPDTTRHLCGPYDGWRVERYGATVTVIDAKGMIREATDYDSEEQAREAVFKLADAAYEGRWK